MFTRCPSCQTLFRVRAETLRVAQGQVRCGRCGAQFNALNGLAEDPETLATERNGALVETDKAAATSAAEQPAPDVPDAAPQEGTSGIADEAPDALDGRATGPVQTSNDDAAADSQITPQAVDSEVEVDQVTTIAASSSILAETELAKGLSASEIQEALLRDGPASSPWGLRLAGMGAVLLLLTALIVQWMYMQRVPLYAQPEWRPVLQRLCAVLDCELPLPRQPEQVQILERAVREHPRVAKALLVDLTFISRARELIAYPIVELRLADVSGNRVMGRQFSPSEYLPASVDGRTGMSPDRPVRITLELVAPAADVVSFQFDFH
jgi:predicted Zn finger-like uncharacterized protein